MEGERDWPDLFRRMALTAGAVCAIFFGALWLMTGRAEFLGTLGGLWALGQIFAGLAAYAGRRARRDQAASRASMR